jgi:hypothetical protein
VTNAELWLERVVVPALNWLRALPLEVDATLRNPAVLAAVLPLVVLGTVSLSLGVWLSRRIGALDPDAPAGETLGVGLGSGLLAVVAIFATWASSGRSSFTPIAVGLVAAAILTYAKRSVAPPAGRSAAEEDVDRRRAVSLIPTILASTAFLVLVGVLYGTTLAPSPRDGIQPVEFMDEAYYPVLARDLASTGIEAVATPSGFDAIPGLPQQAWYHWGELWLSALGIGLFGLEPMVAHYFVALPLLLLATAALTGTVVRTVARTNSRAAFALGFVAAVILAPVPLRVDPFFGWWARGLVFGITLYGLAAVVVLLGIQLAVRPAFPDRSPSHLYRACVFAASLPAHIVAAAFGAVAATFACAATVIAERARHPRAWPSRVSRDAMLAAGSVVGLTVITLAWGLATDHGLGATAQSPSVSAFNASWISSITLTILGAGVFLLIPMLLVYRRVLPTRSLGLLFGSTVAIVCGAIAWGARISDFNAFHFYFGTLALFGTPAAAVSVWLAGSALRRREKPLLRVVLLSVLATQLAVGVIGNIQRLVQFGPGTYDTIDVAMLNAIEGLPPGARIAYACQPFEEVSFWDPRLMSIGVHTGRSVVPMCFQAEFLSGMTGGTVSEQVPSPYFQWAPQMELYPTASAEPSLEATKAFMRRHGIEYIYADQAHPNTLVPSADIVLRRGDAYLLRTN